jgi:hypothetical protein
LLLLVCAVSTPQVTRGQEAPLPPCDQTRALLLIQQQLDKAKAFNQTIPRISIMLRAAELLWPVQRETARTLFADAYEAAEAHFLRKDEEAQSKRPATAAPEDARPMVLQAIARHDAEWAKRLSARFTDVVKDNADPTAQLTPHQVGGAEVLGLATLLLPANKELAVALARSSFQYPASVQLADFLYRLAEMDQPAADQLYLEALSGYAKAPISKLLYLSAYPFGLNRPAGPEAPAIFLQVPRQFTPNARAQQLFMAALLQRGDSLIQQLSGQTGAPSDSTELAQLHLALSGLEQFISQSQPAFLERARLLRTSAAAYLSTEEVQNITAQWQRQRDELHDPFTTFIEKAEQATNSPRRDALIAHALMAATDAEQIERVEKLLAQVEDSDLRHQLFNWCYFKQTQEALAERRFDDATRLAEKVEVLEHRAYLLFEIAAQVLEKSFDDRARARELLDHVAAAAAKAPDTDEKARTMLGVVYLYAKFDPARALEVLSDAVRAINAVGAPDLNSLALSRRVQGRGFTIYATYQLRGFSLENTVPALAAYDFEGTLALAQRLEHPPLRATAILALAAHCLKQARPQKAHKRLKY